MKIFVRSSDPAIRLIKFADSELSPSVSDLSRPTGSRASRGSGQAAGPGRPLQAGPQRNCVGNFLERQRTNFKQFQFQKLLYNCAWLVESQFGVLFRCIPGDAVQTVAFFCTPDSQACKWYSGRSRCRACSIFVACTARFFAKSAAEYPFPGQPVAPSVKVSFDS